MEDIFLYRVIKTRIIVVKLKKLKLEKWACVGVAPSFTQQYPFHNPPIANFLQHPITLRPIAVEGIWINRNDDSILIYEYRVTFFDCVDCLNQRDQ